MQPDGTSQQDQQFGGEEFRILDTDGSLAGRDTTSIQAESDSSFPSPLTRFAYGTFNVFVSCSALATAKQIVNPANYMQTEEAAKEASKQLPEWFAAQYKSRRMASDMTRNILKDTSVLMAASATWYGVQLGLKAVRGKEDAFNACAAGSLSAALLGAVFIEPFKLSRTGLWGAVGGVAGYYGFKEQQALRAALLQRQQELEQKHLHKSPDEVHTKLNSKLLKQLLEKEQQEKVDQFKARVNKEAAASKADAEAGTSDNWQNLINSAPWLEQQQQQQQRLANPQESSEY